MVPGNGAGHARAGSLRVCQNALPLVHADTGTITDACREEVYQFKIQRNSNINLNVPLGGCNSKHVQGGGDRAQWLTGMATVHSLQAYVSCHCFPPMICSQGLQDRRRQVLQCDLVLWLQGWPGHCMPQVGWQQGAVVLQAPGRACICGSILKLVQSMLKVVWTLHSTGT